jgi:hypothetical protein
MTAHSVCCGNGRTNLISCSFLKGPALRMTYGRVGGPLTIVDSMIPAVPGEAE